MKQKKDGIINRMKNLFYTLIQDNSDEKEIEKELEKINIVQINLKKEKDYINSLEVATIPRVKTSKNEINKNQNQKHRNIDMEIGE